MKDKNNDYLGYYISFACVIFLIAFLLGYVAGIANTYREIFHQLTQVRIEHFEIGLNQTYIMDRVNSTASSIISIANTKIGTNCTGVLC